MFGRCLSRSREISASFLSGVLLVLVICMLTSCAPPLGDNDVAMDGMPPAWDAGESHADEGPHHGALIELGDEEFHAELICDDRTVTIYVLDESARVAVPIASEEITINMIVAGEPEQFKLAATPQETDGEGNSSRFCGSDEKLIRLLHQSSVDATLVLAIQGTSYRGKLKHAAHGPE